MCGGVGMRFLMRSLAHLDQARRILQERVHFSREILRECIVVGHDYRSAALFKHMGVVKLLHVLVERIRHKNSRTRGKSNIGDRHRTRTRDNQIGAMHRGRNVVDKRDDLGRELHFAVCPPHQLYIRLAGLMHHLQVQIYNTFSIDFESGDDT